MVACLHYSMQVLQIVDEPEGGRSALGLLREQLHTGPFDPMRAQVTCRPWLGTSAGSFRAAGCSS